MNKNAKKVFLLLLAVCFLSSCAGGNPAVSAAGAENEKPVVVAIDAGGSNTVCLMSDGTVKAYGSCKTGLSLYVILEWLFAFRCS